MYLEWDVVETEYWDEGFAHFGLWLCSDSCRRYQVLFFES